MEWVKQVPPSLKHFLPPFTSTFGSDCDTSRLRSHIQSYFPTQISTTQNRIFSHKMLRQQLKKNNWSKSSSSNRNLALITFTRALNMLYEPFLLLPQHTNGARSMRAVQNQTRKGDRMPLSSYRKLWRSLPLWTYKICKWPKSIPTSSSTLLALCLLCIITAAHAIDAIMCNATSSLPAKSQVNCTNPFQQQSRHQHCPFQIQR